MRPRDDVSDSSLDDCNERDSEDTVRTKAIEKGVIVLPGTVFMPNGGKTPYVRASFSLLGQEAVDEGLKRLREAILEARKELN